MGMWQANNRVVLKKELSSTSGESSTRKLAPRHQEKKKAQGLSGMDSRLVVGCEEADEQKVPQSGQAEQYWSHTELHSNLIS